MADLDHDGNAELIYCDENSIIAKRPDGTTIWETFLTGDYDSGLNGGFSVGDMDQNGKNELYMSSDDDVYGYAVTQIYGLDHQGETLAGFPKIVYGSAVPGTPLIGDLDGDGRKDLLVASGDTSLVAWDEHGQLKPGYPKLETMPAIYSVPALADLDQDGDLDIVYGDHDDRIYVLDLPGAYRPHLIDWGMFRHDQQNSNWAQGTPTVDMSSEP